MEKVTIRSLLHLVVLTLLASPAIGAPLASPRAALDSIPNIAYRETTVFFPKRHADFIGTPDLVSRQFQDGSSGLVAGENGKGAIRARQGFQDGSSELGAGEENGKRAIRARQGFQDGSSELGASESNGKRAIRARQGFQDGSSELGVGEENGKRAIEQGRASRTALQN